MFVPDAQTGLQQGTALDQEQVRQQRITNLKACQPINLEQFALENDISVNLAKECVQRIVHYIVEKGRKGQSLKVEIPFVGYFWSRTESLPVTSIL